MSTTSALASLTNIWLEKFNSKLIFASLSALFISPLSIEDMTIKFRLFNNSDDWLVGSVLIGEYNKSEAMLNYTTQVIKLNSKSSEEYTIPISDKSSQVKCFLWKGMDSLIPLYRTRLLLR